MKILCVGDVCGSIGCDAIRKNLPKFKEKYNIDINIKPDNNLENSSFRIEGDRIWKKQHYAT